MKIQREATLRLFEQRTIRLKMFFVFFLYFITECKIGSASRALTIQTGGSVVIPCYYDRKYTEYKKYWCFHAKAAFNYCSILAYANETKGKVSVIDHPDQSFFTVTMRNLQQEDTGAYWCAVEIKGFFHLDEKEQHQLTVQSAPDVSVMDSRVSRHEGDDVSVQCFYSSGYKNTQKRWCRYNNERCFKEKKTDTSQSSSVQISDDGESSFIVLMIGLRLSDSGWYFCSAGNLQVPVQLTVTEGKSQSLITLTDFYMHYLEVWIPAVLLLLLLMLIALVTSTVILRKKHDFPSKLSSGRKRPMSVKLCSKRAQQFQQSCSTQSKMARRYHATLPHEHSEIVRDDITQRCSTQFVLSPQFQLSY
ncbi:polymeric immunoglobulin receptor-like [Danio aesculapii]|uniref:polymeric immunoglobulin receptor-like n=1 Tax=Danio aesculapii TaxID=1142201 RepID=UPI0024C0C2AC|nr:polymeric immunoglobulin receptor-like [Danio aesculapii]